MFENAVLLGATGAQRFNFSIGWMEKRSLRVMTQKKFQLSFFCQVEDSTGRLEVLQWKEEDKSFSTDYTEGQFVKVVGSIRTQV